MPLQTGLWSGVWNGQSFGFWIKNVDNQGNVNGTVDHLGSIFIPKLAGFWDEDSQKLVLAIPRGGLTGLAGMVILKGFLFQDSNRLASGGSVTYTLVGYSIAMTSALLGTTSAKSRFGWYAQIGLG